MNQTNSFVNTISIFNFFSLLNQIFFNERNFTSLENSLISYFEQNEFFEKLNSLWINQQVKSRKASSLCHSIKTTDPISSLSFLKNNRRINQNQNQQQQNDENKKMNRNNLKVYLDYKNYQNKSTLTKLCAKNIDNDLTATSGDDLFKLKRDLFYVYNKSIIMCRPDPYNPWNLSVAAAPDFVTAATGFDQKLLKQRSFSKEILKRRTE